jgi:hypothetical protein
VLVRTPSHREPGAADHIRIDWGEEFAASYEALFPDHHHPAVAISHGPVALDYILAAGGTGYFRKGFIRPYLDKGDLELVSHSPEFSYSAYLVHSAKTDEGTTEYLRSGLRAAASLA